MQPHRPGFSLCVITRGSDREIAVLERALPVGAPGEIAVLLRDKTSAPDLLRPVAERLAALARGAGASLWVHTHVSLAHAVGAVGVHLASRPAPGFRGRIPAAQGVGVSCHDAAQLRLAAREGADYAFLSPFASVAGKAPPLGVRGFSALARKSPLPVVALGGIDPDSAAQSLAAGASAVACIRAVLDAADPENATHLLLGAVRSTRLKPD